jgi:hypothetical protein
MTVVLGQHSGSVDLVVSALSHSVDGASGSRRNVISASNTAAITLVARLFPGIDDLAALRHVELKEGLMSASYSSPSTQSATTPV